ncbi:MAG: FtsB family cell division protein [Desulfobulbales bacterium]
MHSNITSRDMKLLSYIGLFILALLILWIIFAPGKGIVALHRLQNEMEKLQTANSRLTQENEALQAEIKKLQNDPAFLEEKARKEYGMLKKNEVLYLFDKKGK